jgi:hypothetical protein
MPGAEADLLLRRLEAWGETDLDADEAGGFHLWRSASPDLDADEADRAGGTSGRAGRLVDRDGEDAELAG